MRSSLALALIGTIQIMQDGQPAFSATPVVDHIEVDGTSLDVGTLGAAIFVEQITDATSTPILGRYRYSIDHTQFPAALTNGQVITLRMSADVGGQVVHVDRVHAMVNDLPAAAAPGLPYIN